MWAAASMGDDRLSQRDDRAIEILPIGIGDLKLGCGIAMNIHGIGARPRAMSSSSSSLVKNPGRFDRGIFSVMPNPGKI
jgi:hypothetical protein